MKIYEFRSDTTSYSDGSEGELSVETELFLSKDKAIKYMRNKALEYEKANKSEKFYRGVDSNPNDAEEIELYSSQDSDVFGIFSVNEREVNE